MGLEQADIRRHLMERRAISDVELYKDDRGAICMPWPGQEPDRSTDAGKRCESFALRT